MSPITVYGRETVSLELRDTSPNAIAEIKALVGRYGGTVAGDGPDLHVRADDHKALDTIRAALENDPRVVSNEELAVAAHMERFAEQEAERHAALEADRVHQLEAKVAEQAQRIAELEHQ
ncbi:MAG: hypothetical protein ACRD0V_09940 [Acidimicrobiales bacterium]